MKEENESKEKKEHKTFHKRALIIGKIKFNI